MRNLLLLSSSRVPQNPRWLEYAAPDIRSFLHRQQVTEAVFVPYAGVSMGYDKYMALARPTFERMGFGLKSVHEARDPVEAILSAPAICVGGGNTYFLNRMLHERGLRDAIRKRVLEDGVPYVGWSAGSNVAFGGILTTNDWNIANSTAFQGLGLIEGGLQLNPHENQISPCL